jgi:hypothetical protein
VLIEYKKRIRDVLRGHQEWFDGKLVEMAEYLAEMWELVPTNPLVFAPFAIPARTKPSPVVIHNCAFAEYVLRRDRPAIDVFAAVAA